MAELLLLSNSTNAGEEYLGWPRALLTEFIQQHRIHSALFIPFAGVTISWDEYALRVQDVFNPMGCSVTSIHTVDDPHAAITDCSCIIVGGGNTFSLFEVMHRLELMGAIRQKVQSGTPFIGWSAGSNIACPTLRTTNDMPVIQPASFDGLNLVPFQINPHYLDANPEGHGGETREQRILEFLEINRKITVVGLREATALLVSGDHLVLLGNRSMRVFRYGVEPMEIKPGRGIDDLLTA